MAVTYRKLDTPMNKENEVKPGKVSLKEEIKKTRSADKLALGDTTGNFSDNQMGQVLVQYIDEQKRIVENLSKVLNDLEKTKKYLEDESHMAEQMALNGVHKAQVEAQKITMKNLQVAQEKSIRYIETLVTQAQKRTERLRKNTRETRFIPITTWLISLLNLIFLIYILWCY